MTHGTKYSSPGHGCAYQFPLGTTNLATSGGIRWLPRRPSCKVEQWSSRVCFFGQMNNGWVSVDNPRGIIITVYRLWSHVGCVLIQRRPYKSWHFLLSAPPPPCRSVHIRTQRIFLPYSTTRDNVSARISAQNPAVSRWRAPFPIWTTAPTGTARSRPATRPIGR